MVPQVLAHRLAQPARAVAVHHPHLGQLGEKRPVEIEIQLVQRRLDTHSDELELARRRRGVGAVDAGGPPRRGPLHLGAQRLELVHRAA